MMDEPESLSSDVITCRTEAYAMLIKTLNGTRNPEVLREGLKMLQTVRESLPYSHDFQLFSIDGGKTDNKSTQ